ncbi:MAG TPA: hypothetical protein VIV58_23080 [Kofleriaceae bacterium]
MKTLVLAGFAVLGFACSKHEDAAPKKATVPPLPAGEVQRGQDACAAYIAKVCACTSPAGQKQCALAKALPEAMKLALDTAANPETDRADALRAQTNVLETAKQCIEQSAKPCP